MRLFRVVRHDPPTHDDFTSHEAMGKPLPKRADAALARRWRGVSVLTTLELAREVGRGGRLGSWVAELEVPDSVERDIDAERPLGRHLDLFGATPEQLLGYTLRIHPL